MTIERKLSMPNICTFLVLVLKARIRFITDMITSQTPKPACSNATPPTCSSALLKVMIENLKGGIEAGLAMMVAIPNSYCRKSDTIITKVMIRRCLNGLDDINKILSPFWFTMDNRKQIYSGEAVYL